jgi:Fe2+ or Zn2+ uptake regulation protein
MCKLRKKVLDDDPEAYMELVNDPHFLCTKCGRVANSKKNICKPVKLTSPN